MNGSKTWVLCSLFLSAVGCAASVEPLDGSVTDARRMEGGTCSLGPVTPLIARLSGGLTGRQVMQLTIGPAIAATIETTRCTNDTVCTFGLPACRSEGEGSFEEFSELVRSPEVQRALRDHTSFGTPVPDGLDLTITDGPSGSFVVWGVECTGTPGCVAPPPDVKKLVEYIATISSIVAPRRGCNCL